jgi:hypothetical protein
MTSVYPLHRSVSEGGLGRYPLLVLTMKTSKACGSNPLRTVAIHVLHQVLFASGCHTSWIPITTSSAESILFCLFVCLFVFNIYIFLCQWCIFMGLSPCITICHNFLICRMWTVLDAICIVCELKYNAVLQ